MTQTPAITIVLRIWAEENKLPPERAWQIFENVMREVKKLKENNRT